MIAPDVDETPLRKELPRAHALRLAEAKAHAVLDRFDGPAVVLAADTVVAMGRRILPKTESRKAAGECLENLSGRRHRVYGGIALAVPDMKVRAKVVVTQVQMRRLQRSEIDAYLDSGEWQGKAGGYAIQGRAAAFVPQINGSYSNIVGLPLCETLMLLAAAGMAP